MYNAKTCNVTFIEKNIKVFFEKTKICADAFFSIIAAFFFAFAFTGCADNLISPLEVENISWDSEKISIRFSSTPDESAFQKGFSMTEDKTALFGTFRFAGSTASFFPANGIRENFDYQIILSTDIEDNSGRSLLHDFPYFFSTRKMSDLPYIISQTPEKNAELNYQPEEFSFTFSKPVSQETFLQSFTVSPAFSYFYEFSDNDTKVHIIPAEPLQKSTVYTLSVSTSLEDKSQLSMAKEYNSVFFYAFDETAPEISVQCEATQKEQPLSFDLNENCINEGIPIESQIILNFSKETNLSTVAGAVSISPPLSYTIQIDKENWKKAVICPSTPEWGKTYTLRIKDSIEDFSKNKIPRESCYTLRYNSETDRPVSFASGFFQNSEESYSTFSEKTNFSQLSLDPLFYAKNTERNGNLFLAFKISKESQGLNLCSLLDGVNFSITNNCCSIILKNAQIIQAQDFEQSPLSTLLESMNIQENSEGKLAVVKFTMEVTNKNSSGLVTLELSKSISDYSGNKLKNEIQFTLNK